MIAETLLACWLIGCAYVPFVLAVTSAPGHEEARVAKGLKRRALENVATRVTVAQRALASLHRSFPDLAAHQRRLKAESQITRAEVSE